VSQARQLCAAAALMRVQHPAGAARDPAGHPALRSHRLPHVRLRTALSLVVHAHPRAANDAQRRRVRGALRARRHVPDRHRAEPVPRRPRARERADAHQDARAPLRGRQGCRRRRPARLHQGHPAEAARARDVPAGAPRMDRQGEAACVLSFGGSADAAHRRLCSCRSLCHRGRTWRSTRICAPSSTRPSGASTAVSVPSRACRSTSCIAR